MATFQQIHGGCRWWKRKFWGAYRVARGARIAAGGSLTLVPGFQGALPSETSVLEGAINAALESLARGLALEMSPVRVNTVSPVMIVTPLWSGMSDEVHVAKFEAVLRACWRSAWGTR